MSDFTTNDIKKCDTCGQTISAIQHLISNDKIISYNEKTNTWIVQKVVSIGDKKT